MSRWKHIYASVAGTSHVRDALPCQDYAFGTSLIVHSDEYYLAACADGAGSAAFAKEAAQLSTNSAVTRAASELERAGSLPEDAGSWLRDIVLSVRSEVLDVAAESERAARDYASTFLMTVVGPRRSGFVQIGDGAIVVARGASLTPVFWPDSGEYINTTRFLTDEDATVRIHSTTLEERVDRLAMFTDGLQQLALSFVTRTAHQPFFEPMLDALATHDAAALEIELQRYLNSDPINMRTDDDKTLLLALRVSGDGEHSAN